MTLFQLMLALSAAIIVVNCLSLKAIPERGHVAFCDEDYVAHANLSVQKYTRHGDYYVNIHGETKHTWSENVTIHTVLFQYLHNEYKRSFIELKLSFCDVLKDPYLGHVFVTNGISCPAPPKIYHLINGSVPLQEFPFVFPFDKFRMDMTFIAGDKVFCKAEIFAKIVPADKKPSKKG